MKRKGRYHNMTNMEMVEKICEKANVTYEEAKGALERNNWDMLDAMIDLERRGKVSRTKSTESSFSSSFSYSDTSGSVDAASYRQVEATASGGRTEKKNFSILKDEIKKLVRKGLDNSFVVRRNGKNLFSIPVLVFVIMLIAAFWVTIPLLIVGVIFHFRYGFAGNDLGREGINGTMEKAADYVDDLVQKFREERRNKKNNQ